MGCTRQRCSMCRLHGQHWRDRRIGSGARRNRLKKWSRRIAVSYSRLPPEPRPNAQRSPRCNTSGSTSVSRNRRPAFSVAHRQIRERLVRGANRRSRQPRIRCARAERGHRSQRRTISTLPALRFRKGPHKRRLHGNGNRVAKPGPVPLRPTDIARPPSPWRGQAATFCRRGSR